MANSDKLSIRLCEWASRSAAELTTPQREDIHSVIIEWSRLAGIPDLPLRFQGPNGTTLSASHYVGVVEVGDVCIEIFPKLDQALLDKDFPSCETQTRTLMANLLWMMETCRYMDLIETDMAYLSSAPVSFYDIIAYLLAKRLRSDLEAGIPHFYVFAEDDLHTIRGRIEIQKQISRYCNRPDRIICSWDNYTVDIPLNRLFKCTCRVLRTRVSNPAASHLLDQCYDLLDGVSDASPREAIIEIGRFRWHKGIDRFRECFDVAVRLLAGTSYEIGIGEEKNFVFLIDMNSLFESFVGAVLAASFGVKIRVQNTIGSLFTSPECIHQRPDYLWFYDGHSWVGDAKYKILADDGRQGNSPSFKDLSPHDVRQLSVYADMIRETGREPPSIALLYPFVGDVFPSISPATTWNGSAFWIVPVRVTRPQREITDIHSLMPRGFP